MAKNKQKKSGKPAKTSKASSAPTETRASESLTVFWATTVLTVLLANLVAIAAHFYAVANPEAEKMRLLQGLLLFTGASVGSVSLLVLPILYRVRHVPPPTGLVVFGTCVAVAPILTVIVQAMQ